MSHTADRSVSDGNLPTSCTWCIFFPTIMINLLISKERYRYYLTFFYLLSPLKVVQQFREAGFMADMSNDQSATLNKKIRTAQLAQYNYIFGKDEKLR